MSTPNLDPWRTPSLRLRRLTDDDLPHLLRLHSDPRVMATLGGLRDEAETRACLQRYRDHWERHGFGWWGCFDAATGAFAGRGGLRLMPVEGREETEIGYGFLAEFWGR